MTFQGLKAVGHKLKNSLHHLSPKGSPKNKKCDEGCEESGVCSTCLNGDVFHSEVAGCVSPVPTHISEAKAAVVHVTPACSACTVPAPEHNVAPLSRAETPTWAPGTNIFPTMHYIVQSKAKDSAEQSIILVNPSRTTRTYTVNCVEETDIEVEKSQVQIQGDYVERVKVTFPSVNETKKTYCLNVCCEGNLYDKIRIDTIPKE